MNKKVLIISASPRKGGNSDTLCDEFAKGAKESGNSVEKINLVDKNIGFCKACYACTKLGKCFQKDDVNEILEKMMDTDVLVLASPVYFYTMNAQMKTLIDRTVPLYEKMKNKDIYLIATAAETGEEILERTIDGFRGFMDCYDGFVEKGVIRAAGVYQVGEVQSTKYMQQAYDMGKNV